MQARVGRSGWSDEETRALMDAAHRARAAGRPLREVFDAAAFKTGRKPNSIRNYYYACSRMEEGARRERFTPFGDDEAENLAEAILTARAATSGLCSGFRTSTARCSNPAPTLSRA